MHKPRFALVYLFLAFVVAGTLTVLAADQLTDPRTEKVKVTVAQPPPGKDATADDMLRALGEPDGLIAGSALNPQLGENPCAQYNRPDSITFVCLRPAA